jgi:hypothetical protein
MGSSFATLEDCCEQSVHRRAFGNYPEMRERSSALSGKVTGRAASKYRRSGLVQCRLFRWRNKRHGFASTTLLRWYRAGENAERRLPILSAYLGHVHWSDTFWYLSAMPELMHEAMSRLERRWEDRP